MSDEVKLETAEEGSRWWLVLALGLLLAIGSEPAAHWLLSLVGQKYAEVINAFAYGFEHLGVVLVVAWVVRVAIEKASQRAFIRVVNNKVREEIERSIDKIATESLAPLKTSIRKLDEELGFAIRRPGILDHDSQEVLKNKILNPKFIRTAYSLHLTLEPLSGSPHAPPGFVRVRSRVIYDVKNITNKTEKYTVEAWVDAMFEPTSIGPQDESRFLNFSCGARGQTNFQFYDLGQMKAAGRIRRDHGAVWLGHELENGIPAETTYFADIEAVQIMRAQDIFVWTMSGLTQKLSVSIEFAGGYTPADFHVEARELHHIGREEFRRTHKDEKGVHSWSINQVLLPHQGVEIWWSLHDKTATPAVRGNQPVPARPHGKA